VKTLFFLFAPQRIAQIVSQRAIGQGVAESDMPLHDSRADNFQGKVSGAQAQFLVTLDHECQAAGDNPGVIVHFRILGLLKSAAQASGRDLARALR